MSYLRSGYIAVTSSATEVIEVTVDNSYNVLAMVVKNLAASANALSAFVVQTKAHPDAPYSTYISGADWVSTAPDLVYVSTTPITLAAGANSEIRLALPPCYSLRITATSAGTSSIECLLNLANVSTFVTSIGDTT